MIVHTSQGSHTYNYSRITFKCLASKSCRRPEMFIHWSFDRLECVRSIHFFFINLILKRLNIVKASRAASKCTSQFTSRCSCLIGQRICAYKLHSVTIHTLRRFLLSIKICWRSFSISLTRFVHYIDIMDVIYIKRR